MIFTAILVTLLGGASGGYLLGRRLGFDDGYTTAQDLQRAKEALARIERKRPRAAGTLIGENGPELAAPEVTRSTGPYYGHTPECPFVTTPAAEVTVRTRCTCGKTGA